MLCRELTEALLPQELIEALFSAPGGLRLLLPLTLSLHFMPWQLLSDGESFLVERSVVLKVIL